MSDDPALLVRLLGAIVRRSFSFMLTDNSPGYDKLMERRPVRSSMLASVGYDRAASTLEVAFVGGGIYQYFEVPTDIYVGLMSASSHGTYFDAHVKQAGYRYTKVG